MLQGFRTVAWAASFGRIKHTSGRDMKPDDFIPRKQIQKELTEDELLSYFEGVAKAEGGNNKKTKGKSVKRKIVRKK
jgi:hypothetical protein